MIDICVEFFNKENNVIGIYLTAREDHIWKEAGEKSIIDRF